MNNWREIYQSKLTTANEAIKFIHDGDKVVTGFGCVSEFTTSHFYEIPDLIKNYICPKVAIVMVSPPDEHGYVSFGTTVDYTRGTADYCDIIIAQVNKYMPRTFGNSFMHVRDFTCFVECNEPLPEVKSIIKRKTKIHSELYWVRHSARKS